MFGAKKDANYSSQVETILGNGTSFNGNIQSSGSIRIDGQFEGELVLSGDLILGEKGQLKGQVKAQNALIAGKMIGNLRVSDKAELLSTAKLDGDIEANVLSIGEGAIFRGACEMKGLEDKKAAVAAEATTKKK